LSLVLENLCKAIGHAGIFQEFHKSETIQILNSIDIDILIVTNKAKSV